MMRPLCKKLKDRSTKDFENRASQDVRSQRCVREKRGEKKTMPRTVFVWGKSALGVREESGTKTQRNNGFAWHDKELQLAREKPMKKKFY